MEDFDVGVTIMKNNIFLLAAVLTLTASISTNADLISVEIVKGPFQHPDGLHDTWRVVAFFDDPLDRVGGVVGLHESPLWFYTGSGELYNQELFDGRTLNDFPSAGILGGEEYDTYVTIGATEFPSNIQFSPNFLGDWGDAPPPVQVILGSEFGPDADSMWYYFQPDDAPPVGIWNNEVILAQITVDKGAGFYLQTGVWWFDSESGVDILTTFSVNNIPTPGVLALMGLVALVNRRRRLD